jgi:oligopeptide/dipeptide ABC transporter ATP-binding protein
MALLEVRDLHTSFQTRDGTVRAVDGVSFQVEEGETIALAGESGCGKSVTALSLMRLLPSPPARIGPGEILFDGRDVLKLRPEEMRRIRGNQMAMIFQDPMTSLNPVLAIGRQIAESIEVHQGVKGAAARRRAVELLELVGIPGPDRRVDDYPHQFSGGMRQRVTIAAALSCSPKLILADEITTALDVTIQAQILDVLRHATKEVGTALVIITHDLGVVAGMTQRVLVMYAGQIVESADTVDLFANPRMPYTWGLLRSVPRLDEDRPERLEAIEGLPPDLIDPPAGCRFEPRCRYARDICAERSPDLIPVPGTGPGHAARCWGTQDVPEGGWLRETGWRDAPPPFEDAAEPDGA